MKLASHPTIPVGKWRRLVSKRGKERSSEFVVGRGVLGGRGGEVRTGGGGAESRVGITIEDRDRQSSLYGITNSQ